MIANATKGEDTPKKGVSPSKEEVSPSKKKGGVPPLMMG